MGRQAFFAIVIKSFSPLLNSEHFVSYSFFTLFFLNGSDRVRRILLLLRLWRGLFQLLLGVDPERVVLLLAPDERGHFPGGVHGRGAEVLNETVARRVTKLLKKKRRNENNHF